MSVFRFELEAVLTQRRAAERVTRQALAHIEREREAIEDYIRECHRGALTARNDLRDRLGAGGLVDLRSVRVQAGASLTLVARAQRAVLELAGVHKRIDAARIELLRAAVRRKSVESLRERRYAEWARDQARKEEARLDELMVMRGAGEEIQS